MFEESAIVFIVTILFGIFIPYTLYGLIILRRCTGCVRRRGDGESNVRT